MQNCEDNCRSLECVLRISDVVLSYIPSRCKRSAKGSSLCQRTLVCPGAKEQGHRDRVSPLRHVLAPCKWALFCEGKSRTGYRNFAVNALFACYQGSFFLESCHGFVMFRWQNSSDCKIHLFFSWCLWHAKFAAFRKSASMTPGVVCPFNVGPTCISQASIWRLHSLLWKWWTDGSQR